VRIEQQQQSFSARRAVEAISIIINDDIAIGTHAIANQSGIQLFELLAVFILADCRYMEEYAVACRISSLLFTILHT
jgi:hypothetical protein